MSRESQNLLRAEAGLGAHRFLMRATLAAVSAFAWIFALQLFLMNATVAQAFVRVISLYALMQVITALFTPLAADMLRHGIKRVVRWGTVFAAISLVLWGAALSGARAGGFGALGSMGIMGFAIFMGLYRAFYWVPYEVTRVHLHVRHARNVPRELFVALMPAIAGFSISSDSLGPIQLLFGGASVILVALLPLMYVKERHEKFSWGYLQTFGELIDIKHRSYVVSAFLDGIQGATLFLLWPLFVFMLVGSSYVTLGLVLTATLIIAVPLRSYGMRFVRDRTPVVRATLAASAWVLRLVVASPIGVVIVDSYASFGSSTQRSGDIYALEQGADNGTYIDEFTALKEVSLALGRLFLCGFAAACILIFSLGIGLAAAFALAAASAAYSIYLSHWAEPAVF